jgi:hypothetical protein
MGQPTDPDLIRYNRMTPADFERLTAEHGQQAVDDYIREMEVRRMRG